MKKIISLFLAILMLFCFTSCELDLDSMLEEIGLGSSQDDDDDYDEEEEEEEEEEESEEQSGEIVIPPVSTVDKTEYSNKTSQDGTEWYYGATALTAPSFTNYYHGYKSALTMTFDDGYDVGTGEFVSSVFERYGFRGTAMLGPCFLESNDGTPNSSLINSWNKVFAKGYLDVGCHGYAHINPHDLSESGYEHEIKDAIDFLREHFPSQRVLTFATPYAQITSSYESYLKNYVISNRLELGGNPVEIDGDYDIYRVKSFSFKKDTVVSLFNTNIGNYLDKPGNWVVELSHCVLDTPYNGTDLSKEQLEDHCEYLYNNYKDTVWFASFEDVTIYLKQLEHAKVNYVASDRESMSLNITCDLDKEIYNIPMTIKVRIPAYVLSGYAVIGDEEYDLSITRGSGVNTIILKDVPVNGEPVKIYFGGNYNYDNDCNHVYGTRETNSATCTTRGYDVMGCGRCGVTYKTNYKKKLAHDFSGEQVVVTEPTLEGPGLDTIKCKNCDTKKEITTYIEDVATYAKITSSDGINQYTYISSMVDGNTSTNWSCGTADPWVELSFNEGKIISFQMDFVRHSSQSFTISVYDGAQWTEVGAWDDKDEQTNSSSVLMELDKLKATKLKIQFTGSGKGCTLIEEIQINAIKETQK